MARAKQQEATFEILDVVATSFATHRINNGYFRETRRFSTVDEETNQRMPTLFSNKEMLFNQFTDQGKATPDFKRFRVTKKDKEVAQQAIDYLHKENALGIIAGNLSDFMDSLMKHISSSIVTSRSFGVIAVIPKVYFENSKKKAVKKELKTSFRESKHIGQIRDAVVGMFTLNEIKFVDRFSCHVCNGSIEGNLVSFFKNFDQTKELPKEGTIFHIRAKVKRHGENFLTKFPETQLNYVRFKVDNK